MLTEIILGFATVLFLLYKLWTINYDYWRNRGVPYLEPEFPFGNTYEYLFAKKFQGDVFKEFYFQFKGHKYGGIINCRVPTLILRDPEVIKQILAKDFSYFTDRGSEFNKKNEPILDHLFNSGGERWKTMRVKLTPTFSTGKMKNMFHLVKACSDELDISLEKHAEKEEIVEFKDYMLRFSIDVVGTCGFGLEIDCLKDPDNGMRKLSYDIRRKRHLSLRRNLLINIQPGLVRALRIRTMPPERQEFFMKTVKDMIRFRDDNGIVRDDFFGLLLQMRNGKKKIQRAEENGKTPENLEINGKDNNLDSQKSDMNNSITNMTEESIAAQCFSFFIAGFETSSATLSFCLYELALNKHIQDRVREEVFKINHKYGGEITPDSLKEMSYLDSVVYETLRKYPPVATLTRDCVADYYLKEDKLKIEKGTRIVVPLLGLHYDPEFYPDPEKFDPERFNEEGIKSRHHYTWLPFGEGPRICIGMRFGLMEVKLGLTKMLSKYEFSIAPETNVPPVYAKETFVTTSENGVPLKITRLKN